MALDDIWTVCKDCRRPSPRKKKPLFYISYSCFLNCIECLYKILCHKIPSIPHYCNEWLQPLCYTFLSQGLSHSKSCIASTAGTLKHSQSMNVLKIDTFIKATSISLCYQNYSLYFEQASLENWR